MSPTQPRCPQATHAQCNPTLRAWSPPAQNARGLSDAPECHRSAIPSMSPQEPYYVRCIKPNDQKSPTLFDEERCRHQVSYLGLLENVRVRRAGFAYRQPYHRFLLRYGLRPPSRDPRTPPPPHPFTSLCPPGTR